MSKMQPASDGATLTGDQVHALRNYRAAFTGAQSLERQKTRLYAGDALRRARAVLGPAEVAIMDMTGGRERSLADISFATGRPEIELRDLLLRALDKLVAHYVAATAEEGA